MSACVLRVVVRVGLDDERAAVEHGDVARADTVDRRRQTTDDHWTWHLHVLWQRHVTEVLLQRPFSDSGAGKQQQLQKTYRQLDCDGATELVSVPSES